MQVPVIRMTASHPAKTERMVDFLPPVRNIAGDRKMVTEIKQKK
jgi:hypothetical protein